MALQQINWTQIDTIPPSGSVIILGSEESRLEGIFVNELNVSGSFGVDTLDTSGDVVIGGNLTVLGTTTIIDSTTISLGDNIVELNGSAASLGGIIVKDTTLPNAVSGSLLWDSVNDRWIAGASGSEQPILVGGSGTSNVLQKIDGGDRLVDSRITDDGTIVTISGATIIKGDLIVEGKTTLIQKNDPNSESLVVSGAMKIVENLINSQIISASLNIQGLGVLSSTSANAEIDLGGFF
jgi:uncharacterized Zn-binding protein involved in type VI secretion